MGRLKKLLVREEITAILVGAIAGYLVVIGLLESNLYWILV